MLSLGIIWNPAMNFFDQIIAEMHDLTKVVFVSKESISEKREFIYDIYKDMVELDKAKIDFKLANLFLSNSNEIVILIFEFDASKITYHPFKKKNVYTELDNIKRHIRQKYGEMINNYQFDNVFHCTDDANEYIYAIHIICKYFSNISEKIMKISDITQENEQ